MMIDFEIFIDRFLSRERKPKEIGRYYPSEAGLCMRQVWYSYKFPKETEKDLLRIFHAGNLVHDFVVDVFRSERNPDVVLVESEFPFKIEQDGFTVSGRVDDLVLLKEEDKKVLVEVKSCRSINGMEEPENTHKMQLQLYMHATGIRNGVVLYVEKNTLKSRSFAVAYDQDWARRIMDRFGLLDRHLKDDVMPAAEGKTVPHLSYMCSRCDYAEECGRDGMEDGGELKTPRPKKDAGETGGRPPVPVKSGPSKPKNGRLSDFVRS
jgi:CRISPR/Cas system-associated exonuclease Cas4 (RecB family)